MRSILLIFIIALLIPSVSGQEKFPFADNIHRFGYGEELNFEVYYNYGLVYTKVGTLLLTADTITQNKHLLYRFQSISSTKPIWDKIYHVKSNYKVLSDFTSLKPYKYSQHSEFGREFVDYNYSFYNDSVKIDFSDTDTSFSFAKQNPNNVFDALSAIYYARDYNFEFHQKGDSLSFGILHSDEFFIQKIYYEGIENFTDNSNKVHSCYLFSAYIKNNAIISDSEKAYVWVSTESNRVPLKISVKIPIGRIEIVYLNNSTFISSIN
jgi:hypothetical protein